MRRKGYGVLLSSIIVLVPIVTAECLAASKPDMKALDKAVITVTDSRGNALADVRVTECQTEEQYTTDVQGQFVCAPSDRMRFFYVVDKQRGLAQIGRLGAGARQLKVELLPARLVSGRVTDPNGRPLAGVQIAPLPMTSSCVFTNDNGEFAVGWLPVWEPRGGLCLMARHVPRNLAALVDISRAAAHVDIQLAPALRLSGTVTAADGTPLPGATVSLALHKWTWSCGTPVNAVVTDESGRFTFAALPQLQEYELHAKADGDAVEELTTGVINVVKDREEIGPIVLAGITPTDATKETGRLLIRVVDEDLKPVDIASIQMWKRQPDGGARAESVLVVSTDTPGLHETEPLAVGKYHALSLHVEGWAPFRKPDVEVRKEPEETITCQLSRGGTIQGIVTDEKGRPVAGLPVVVNSILCRRDVTTEPNGSRPASIVGSAHFRISREAPSKPSRNVNSLIPCIRRPFDRVSSVGRADPAG